MDTIAQRGFVVLTRIPIEREPLRIDWDRLAANRRVSLHRPRVAKRIERKIEVLKASDPGLFTRLNREARMQTLQSLGLAELSQRLETVEKQEEECQKQKVRIEREMVAVVRGVAVEDLDDGSYYGRYSLKFPLEQQP